MENQTIYQDLGFKNREEYLQSLVEDYDVPENTVLALADLLGESEDFDGLISALEDIQ